MAMENYLQPTEFIDSGSRPIVEFAKAAAGGEHDPRQQAIKLYYAVRDNIRYDPYRIQFTPHGLKASTTLAQGYGYCVAKAVLLTAVGRALGIPSRLGFADVKNHLTSDKLKQMMQSDVFIWHGYTEFYLDDKWVKATPAFNQSLCDKTGIKPLEFDGINDSIFHEFDQAGKKHMEYLTDHGSFADLPFQNIMDDFQKHYPLVAEQIKQRPDITIGGNFEDEATAN